MKINISAGLTVYPMLMYVGGSNPILFRKKGMLELDPKMLGKLLAWSVPFGSWKNKTHLFRVVSYDPASNTLHVVGSMLAATQEYLDFLQEENWVKDQKALSGYRSIPASSEDQKKWDDEKTEQIWQQERLEKLDEEIAAMQLPK